MTWLPQILEGFLYYFELDRATRMLKAIQQNSGPGSVLLADHINDYTLASLKVGGGWYLEPRSGPRAGPS